MGNNIVQIVGFIDEPDTKALIYKCHVTSLDNFLISPQYKRQMMFLAAYQVATGLRHLHEQELTHCNMRSFNILVERVQPLKLVISEMSLVISHATSAVAKRAMDPLSKYWRVPVGALSYLAPEILRAARTSDNDSVLLPTIEYPSRDMYAFGIIMAELALRIVYGFESGMLLEDVTHQVIVNQ